MIEELDENNGLVQNGRVFWRNCQLVMSLIVILRNVVVIK